MAEKCGTDDCFYSLFSSQKYSPSPYTARKTSQEEERTWGNLPIAAGQGRFFPRPARDTGRRGHGALKDMADREKRARRLESAAMHGGYFGIRGGRRTEDTGMCRLMLSPQNKDSLPAADRACGLRCSGPRAAGPGRGEAVRAGSAESRRQLPCPGALSAHLRRLCRTQDVRKPPQGRGFPVRRRAAAGYDGCRCVMEQAGGGGISCFGVYPSEAGSFLRERR